MTRDISGPSARSQPTTSMNSSAPPIIFWKGSGNHTRKISAAARAARISVTTKWTAVAMSFSRQTIMDLLSVVESNLAAQPLGLLRARFDVQPPFARGAGGLGGDALARRHQCAAD